MSVAELVQSGSKKKLFLQERNEWAWPIPMEHMLTKRSQMQFTFCFVFKLCTGMFRAAGTRTSWFQRANITSGFCVNFFLLYIIGFFS